jgi:hypothetical protein
MPILKGKKTESGVNNWGHLGNSFAYSVWQQAPTKDPGCIGWKDRLSLAKERQVSKDHRAAV